MAQKKAHEVDGWLARPDGAVKIVLLYGPDRGLVSERARLFAGKTGLPLDDPFSVVRIDAGEAEQQPGRLIDEARTVPMFSDRRLVWIRNAGAGKTFAEEIKVLAGDPPRDAVILIEAGDLKKGAALRSVVEGAFAAIALPCYADEAKGVDAVIDDELQKAGMTITLEARQALRRSLGGDRMASRGEVEKLVLYAQGKDQISLEDVELAIGDVAGLSVDEVIDSVLDGRLDVLETAFARLVASGNNQIYPMLAAAMRQFQTLHALRGAMDSKGQSAAAAVAGARPPVFFSRRRTVENALQRWSASGAARVLERLQNAVLQTRRRPELAEAIARHTLLAIALDSGRR
ncbi:DNA polymerase III subunit delta [Mesorhizobium sp. 1B3]|uniref:DNA polymerase III subunit delta n=1 Tax=Mesorhizobium sp. 1B3 TaxID=3243599 RepID=UPI003D99171E